MCFDAFRFNALKNVKYYQWFSYEILSVINCYSTTKLYSYVDEVWCQWLNRCNHLHVD